VKRFNITFRGETLPNYKLDKVKRDLAGIFSLSDKLIVDRIFSGHTIVLRGDLDRRVASDLYRRVSETGAMTELVSSLIPVRSHRGDVLELTKTGALVPQRPPQNNNSDPATRSSSNNSKSWAISSSRIARQKAALEAADQLRARLSPTNRLRKPLPDETDGNNMSRDISEELSGLQFSAELAERTLNDELQRLDSLIEKAKLTATEERAALHNRGDQMDEELKDKLYALECRRKQAEQDRTAELKKLKGAESTFETESRTHLRELTQEAVASEGQLEVEIQTLRTGEELFREQSAQEIDELKARIAELETAIKDSPDKLLRDIETARVHTDEKIALCHSRGEQIIEDIRQNTANTRQAEAATEERLSQCLEQLREEQLQANGLVVEELARLKEQELEAGRILAEKLVKLEERRVHAREVASEKLALLESKEQALLQLQAN
jgi:hypothetical protein